MFPLGFHRLTMLNVEQTCVDSFPLSKSRRALWLGLTTFHGRLIDAGVAGELWIDGSFLTEKIDPKDVDVVVRCSHALYDAGTEPQRVALDWVNENQSDTLGCDSYLLLEYPPDHALHEEGQWAYSYWHAKWGFSRPPEMPKGIVVVELGDT
jgi:hypothetical protein